VQKKVGGGHQGVTLRPAFAARAVSPGARWLAPGRDGSR
jgi:hypothetical protein